MEWDTSAFHAAESDMTHSEFLSAFSCIRRKTQLSSGRESAFSWVKKFHDNPDLLRGTPGHHVLRRFGAVLRNSTGSAETYELSTPTEYIDSFISHNWSTPRFEKFMVLALYANGLFAFLCTNVLCLILTFLMAEGYLPPMLARSKTSGELYHRSIYCKPFGCIFYYVLLFFWHDIRMALGRLGLGHIVFLDKTCIHQTDPVLKKQGIMNLAGYIAMSKCLLVVYADTYLRKLWTVYELASFLCIHDVSSVVLMPAFLPTSLFGLQLCYISFAMFKEFWRFYGYEYISVYTFNGPIKFSLYCGLGFLNVVILKKGVGQRAAIKTTLKKFSIKHAACFDENDRVLVCKNVAQFVKRAGYVHEEATEEAALLFFDELVREVVPRVLAQSLGRYGIPYVSAVLIQIEKLFQMYDEVGTSIYNGNEPLHVWNVVFCCLFELVVLRTLLLAILAHVVRYSTWKRNPFDLIIVTTGALAFGLGSWLVDKFIDNVLWHMRDAVHNWLLSMLLGSLQLIVLIAGSIAVYLLYNFFKSTKVSLKLVTDRSGMMMGSWSPRKRPPRGRDFDQNGIELATSMG